MKRSDPFGGITGDENKVTQDNGGEQPPKSPFFQDWQQTINDLTKSMDEWDGRGLKKPQESLLKRMRQGKSIVEKTVNSPNWVWVDPILKESANIHFRWANKTIRTEKNVPKKAIRVALVGLSSFARRINPDNPDLSHPDILRCYNLTALNNGLPLVDAPDDLSFNSDKHLDPFAGVRGDGDVHKFNQFKSDLDKAVDQINFSIDFIEQLDVYSFSKEVRFKNLTKTKSITPVKGVDRHFDVSFWWANVLINKVKNIDEKKARMALIAIRRFLTTIDFKSPDLRDLAVLEIYEITQKQKKPGKSINDPIELRPKNEGGMSYWSNVSHRWVKPKKDPKTEDYIAPEQGL